MNSEELRVKLEKLNIPRTSYSINGNIGADIFIFQQVHSYWECFYIDERGNQNNDYRRFDNENEACIYFYEKLKKEYFARANYKGENITNEKETVFLVDANGSIIPEKE